MQNTYADSKMKPINLEQEKLNLEKEKFNRDIQIKESELKLKQEEFDLKKKELRNSRYKPTQAQATILAAFLTLFGVIAGIYIKHDIEQKQEGPKQQTSITKTDSTVTKHELPIKPPPAKMHPQLVMQVYICDSRTASKYHKSAFCGHLKTCKSQIMKISLKEAQDRGRTLCGHEQ
jgi:hypothetical protein